MGFTHLDLFAGIGGFSRAVNWLGGTTVGFVEWDSWNRRVLAKHWPEAHFHGDIKTFTAEVIRDWGIQVRDGSGSHSRRLRRNTGRAEQSLSGIGSKSDERPVDLITGGYPCQPFSLAGQRLGEEDDRHLWPEMRRVVNTVRPRWVLAENVAGHVSMGLDVVLSELEADGYTAGAVVVPAGAVNALHRRDRVWIMAYTEGDLRGASRDDGREPPYRTGDVQGVADANAQRQLPEQESGREGSRDADRKDASLSEFASHTRVGSEWKDEHEALRSLDAGIDGIPTRLVRPPAGRSAWDDPDLIRAMWADGSWEANLPRVVTDEPERRQKLMAAGNAIVPVVAYELLRVMMEAS